jgi:hypothetical protein
MPDDPMTGGENPGATGADDAAATNPQGAPLATDDSEQVTLSKEDYKNLIAGRDRANENAAASEEFVLTLAKEREIDSFLKDHKKDFPDVEQSDLMSAESPEQLKELAEARQARYEQVVQKRLMDVQQSTPPRLSPQEKAEKLKQLKANPGSSAFRDMVDLQQS